MVIAQKMNYKAANVIEFSDYGATIVSELSSVVQCIQLRE